MGTKSLQIGIMSCFILPHSVRGIHMVFMLRWCHQLTSYHVARVHHRRRCIWKRFTCLCMGKSIIATKIAGVWETEEVRFRWNGHAECVQREFWTNQCGSEKVAEKNRFDNKNRSQVPLIWSLRWKIGIGKNQKQLTAAGYQDKVWETRNKKYQKWWLRPGYCFPLFLVWGGDIGCVLAGYWYWLCYVVGDVVVYVDAVYLIYLIGWVHWRFAPS